MKIKVRTYLTWVFTAEAVGLLAGFLTRGGTEIYGMTAQKPPLTPPAIAFPVVWTILYALMGISAARIYCAPDSKERSRGLNIYITQLIFNFFWSLIFFNAMAYGFAFVWILALWGLILWMTVTFYKVDRTAALLQIPYVLWVIFAAYLNYGVWQLNR